MTGNYAIEAKGITKRFGEVVALNDVDFFVQKGEIHGLLGENGAGKTTLMNILYGLYKPDKGEIYINGKKAHISSPLDSIRYGIGMIHQLSTLVPELTAVENIILGMKGEGFSLNLEEESKKIRKLSKKFGFEFPLDVKIRELPAGIKQKVEIIRALYRGASILILDEPTTSLVEEEFEQLLRSIKELVANGVTVIFITHKIKEVLQACNRASVLKGGVMQGTVEIAKTSKEELVSLMFTGQRIDVTDSALPVVEIHEKEPSNEKICVFDSVSTSVDPKKGFGLKDVSFEIYRGEIFGIAGIAGNGQKELAEAIISPSTISSGSIYINGKKINGLQTVDVFSLGVFYTPEDRIKDGILPMGNLKENILLGHHEEAQFVKNRVWLDWQKVASVTRDVIRIFNVKAPNENTNIRKLSGGNIQKVVFGRALLNPIDLLVTHNPTSGLDMASVEFVFSKLVELRDSGKSVLYINEDLDELMLLSDRIGVLHEGRLVEVFPRKQFDKRIIGSLMIGG